MGDIWPITNNVPTPLATGDLKTVLGSTSPEHFTSFDYYLPAYNKELSGVNVYYRGLIEEMSRKHSNELEQLRVKYRALECELNRFKKDACIVVRENDLKMRQDRESKDVLKLRIMELEELIQALRAKDDLRARELGEAKDLLVQKTQLISSLESRLNDTLEANKLAGKHYEDGNKRADELRDKLAKEQSHYEMQLNVKDNIIQDLRNRLNELMRETAPRQTYDREFYGTQGPTTSLTGANNIPSSSKKSDEEIAALKRTLTNQLSQIQDLQSALDSKSAIVNDLTSQIAALQSALNSLQALQGQSDSDRKQQSAKLAQKDDIISKLEDRVRQLVQQESERNRMQADADNSLVRELREKLAAAEAEIARLRNEFTFKEQTIREEERRWIAGKGDKLGEEIAKKDKIIQDLQKALQDAQKEIARLKSRNAGEDKARADMLKNVKLAPKIERIEKPAFEIQYQPDPYVLEQNQKLAEELQKSLDNERRAYSELAGKVHEINQLNRQITDLKANPQKIIQHIPPQPKEISRLARQKITRLTKRANAASSDAIKRLSLAALHYYARARRLARQQQTIVETKTKEGEKVIIKQQLEVVDGTFEVWASIRRSLVAWVYEIFLRSNHHLNQKKTSSFMIFKENMEGLTMDSLSLPTFLLMSTYTRLRNLVMDEISQVEIEALIEQRVKEGWQGVIFAPEGQHRIVPVDLENDEKANQWMEECLCQAIIKRKAEKNLKDADMLHLFRLLSIKFRIEHPYRGRKFIVKPDLMMALESKICSCVLFHFDRLRVKDSMSLKHPRSASTSADKTVPKKHIDTKKYLKGPVQ